MEFFRKHLEPYHLVVNASILREKPFRQQKILWIQVASNLSLCLRTPMSTATKRFARCSKGRYPDAPRKEGVVQFPPTETALMILLRRCGAPFRDVAREEGEHV